LSIKSEKERALNPFGGIESTENQEKKKEENKIIKIIKIKNKKT
jgi:hypothetical protein